MMRTIIIVMCLGIFNVNSLKTSHLDRSRITNSSIETVEPKLPIGCFCGIFMSGDFKKGSKEQPKGDPALVLEHPAIIPCTSSGRRICRKKCIDFIMKHTRNSAMILCESMNRDCVKERAYLFIKNCKDEWINTNLSDGKEYCCNDGIPYKCPILF